MYYLFMPTKFQKVVANTSKNIFKTNKHYKFIKNIENV